MTTTIDRRLIYAAVRNADAAWPETLKSYLDCCETEDEITLCVEQLRRNQPEIFNQRTTKKSRR